MWSSLGESWRRGREQRPASGSIDDLRGEIDRVDAELIELFLARLELAGQIGAHKQALGRTVGDPQREREVLERALEQAGDRCPPALVENLMMQLIHAARFVQGRPRVAYLGPATTHSHRAVLRWFDDARLHATPTLRAAVEAVHSGAVDYAVVPWCNRHAGVIAEVQEAVLAAGTALCVLTWAELSVAHVLAALPGATIERVFCRPEPLAGSRRWLDRELPTVAFDLVASNDEAARMAAATPNSAAITTSAAARAWGLARLVEAIDGDDNRTSFVVLGRSQ